MDEQGEAYGSRAALYKNREERSADVRRAERAMVQRAEGRQARDNQLRLKRKLDMPELTHEPLPMEEIAPVLATDPIRAVHAILQCNLDGQDCQMALSWIDPLMWLYGHRPDMQSSVTKAFAKLSQATPLTPCFYTRAMAAEGVTDILVACSSDDVAGRALGNIIVDVYDMLPQKAQAVAWSLTEVAMAVGDRITETQLWCLACASCALEPEHIHIVKHLAATVVAMSQHVDESRLWDIYHIMKHLVVLQDGDPLVDIITPEFCQTIIISIMFQPNGPVAMAAASLLADLCRRRSLMPPVMKANPQPIYAQVLGVSYKLDEQLLYAAAAFASHSPEDTVFDPAFVSAVQIYAMAMTDTSPNARTGAAWALSCILSTSQPEAALLTAETAIEVLYNSHLRLHSVPNELALHIIRTFQHLIKMDMRQGTLVSKSRPGCNVTYTTSVLLTKMSDMGLADGLEYWAHHGMYDLQMAAGELLGELERKEDEDDMQPSDDEDQLFDEGDSFYFEPEMTYTRGMLLGPESETWAMDIN